VEIQLDPQAPSQEPAPEGSGKTEEDDAAAEIQRSFK
jgi:hypothetical protein